MTNRRRESDFHSFTNLCGTVFAVHYFKPVSFKNMNPRVISKMKLIAHTLCAVYSEDIRYDNSIFDYTRDEIQELLELSKESGYRVLVLDATFDALGIFVFGKNFSAVDYFYGGKTRGFYSLAFTRTQELAREYEHKMTERGTKNNV